SGRGARHDRRARGHDPPRPDPQGRCPSVKIEVVTKRLDEVAADALVVGLYAEETKLPDALARLDRAAAGHIKAALDAERFKAKAGQVTHVHAGKRRVVVAGLGRRAETTLEVLRRGAAGAHRGEVFARATAYARDLINAPANELSPSDLGRAAAQVAKEHRLALRVYDRADCRRMGMGAFLGVAAGSAEPPKFIHLTYAPPGRRTRRVALIGKGITFDSGGLDLKTSEGMLRMKYDMAGAAAV